MATERSVTYIPAGIPPNGSSLIYAITYYGRAGAAVIVGELTGRTPVDEDELAQFILDAVYDFTNRVPVNYLANDGISEGLIDHWMDNMLIGGGMDDWLINDGLGNEPGDGLGGELGGELVGELGVELGGELGDIRDDEQGDEMDEIAEQLDRVLLN